MALSLLCVEGPLNSRQSNLDLSVAICAYNSATRIGMVLESLARQECDPALRWELLVIDNASNDGTGKLVAEMGAKLSLPLRVVHEPNPGLANARRRAAVEAESEFLSFLDDDTVVNPDWVEQCVTFLRDHPDAGIIGAKVLPLFEDPARKPADFEQRFAGLLSLYDKGHDARRLKFPEDPTPVGAGMSGRTSLFRLIFDQFGTMNVGRAQNSLSGGEDIEAIFIADRIGWEVWYAPSLTLQHFLPNHRLTEQYRDKWIIDTASCNAFLGVLSGRQPRGTRMSWLLEWLKLHALVMKYTALSVLPARLHPKLFRFRFYQCYYRSRAKGCRDFVFRPQAAERVFQMIEAYRRPNHSPSPEAVCT